jgi:putative N6-adenine-specific DNA methylase
MATAPRSRRYFAPCPRGLEGLLAGEVSRCGASEVSAAGAGVSFRGNSEVCWRVNLESRLASRVLLQLAQVPYRTERDVYDAARAVDWPALFEVGRSIRVDVNAVRCPLKSLDFVTLRIKDAVCDRFRDALDRRPDVDTRDPDVRIHGFLDASRFTLYLDTSGEPLYKRGWRGDAGEAPLKENLAAGMLMLSGWDRAEPLFDPMCGSGTLLIEAASMALDIAPGARRSFGFEKLSGHDAGRWSDLRERAAPRAKAPRPLEIYGSDLAAAKVQRARQNLEAAGLAGTVILRRADVLEVEAPAADGVLIANPPYGVRLGEAAELAAFYPQLGNAFKARFAGWRCYVFSADPELPRLIRLKATRRTPLFNGPLECRLYEYRMVSGSARKPRQSGVAGGGTSGGGVA